MMRTKDALEALARGSILDEHGIRSLLAAENDDAAFAAILEAARNARRLFFGDRVFLYGFVYFSTFCRNDCAFCYYARSNGKPPRYRKSIDEAVAVARQLADSGVHLIDLTMGEDPLFLTDPAALPNLVERVRTETGLPVMVSPGLLDGDAIQRIAACGASWYALYQETFTPALFERWRTGQNAEDRMAAKQKALDAGMLIEEGLLCGLGETEDDLVSALCAMQDLDMSQVRAMTFIPQEGTSLQNRARTSARRELLLIAVMRLLFPDRLIPASLDVDGTAGLTARLNAGANVVTSIIPPDHGLAGVAHAYDGIADGSRTVAGIGFALEAAGLRTAAPREYRDWLEARSCAR